MEPNVARLVLCSVACLAACIGPRDPVHARSTIDPIAITRADTSTIVLLDRESLQPVRMIASKTEGSAPAPMLVIEDSARRVFYVGNFGRGLARVPFDEADVQELDLDGAVIGLAISPDGRTLAVNGARDLVVRFVDLATWRVVARASIGNAADAPLHSHMTHGLASTHPLWVSDGSAVLTQDNIHEELVLVGADGAIRARRRMPCGVHSFVVAEDEIVLALAEGTVDGTVPPAVVVLRIPSLEIVRTIPIELAGGEPAKLHHGALSIDGDVVVVANMGPMHGDNPGRTVAAVRWRTGESVWSAVTVRNAGHIRFLDADRVLVLGHASADLHVLDARTGRRVETWRIPGATSTGHVLELEPQGIVLVLDSSNGRVVRLADSRVIATSPALGSGVSEASLPE